MEIRYTCPLGSKCEEAKEGYIERCAWYVGITGIDSQGKEQDDNKCAMTWQPILQLETSSTNRGQTAAIESLRNENSKRQDAALQLALSKGFTSEA